MNPQAVRIKSCGIVETKIQKKALKNWYMVLRTTKVNKTLEKKFSTSCSNCVLWFQTLDHQKPKENFISEIAENVFFYKTKAAYIL